jgi:hypothetical protein
VYYTPSSARSQNSGDSADGLTSYSVHGCSAFSQDFPVCTEFDTTGTIDPNGDIHGGDTDETHLRVCKQTCKSEECNDFVVDVPEIAQKNMCYQCQITIDNYGNMVSKKSCFNVFLEGFKYGRPPPKNRI